MVRLLFLLLTVTLFANPENGNVTGGRALILDEGSKLLKIHTDRRAVINWDSFSIEEDEIVRFFHQFKNSAVLNRVTGSDSSQILGKIQSTGRVYIINENGIFIGKDALIDVSSLVCSTLDLPDQDFMRDQDLRFFGASDASLVNFAEIKAREGDILLLSHRIENHGALKAPEGRVQLGSGHDILVAVKGKELLLVKPKLPGDGILNNGTIEALQTLLESNANPLSLGIQNEGRIDALNLEEEGGEIFLRAIGGKITNSGELHADGGTISFESQGASIENAHLIRTPSGLVSIVSKEEGTSPSSFLNKGVIDVTSENPGEIQIQSTKILQEGELFANGKGGKITILPSGEYISSAQSIISANGQEGEISICGGNVLNCGTFEAKGYIGGKVSIFSETITSESGLFDVSGQIQGGDISLISTSSDTPLKLKPKTILDTCAYMKGPSGNVELLSRPRPKCNANIKMDGVKAGKLTISLFDE